MPTTDIMDKLQSEANAYARANKGTTPEQAFSMLLEQNQEIYEQYRNRHNASGMIKTLQEAGVKVSFA